MLLPKRSMATVITSARDRGLRECRSRHREFESPEHQRRLVEPFCGGLAVTLGLLPQRALLNDVNPHLINFYSWLKRGLRISIEMRYHETLFYGHRSRFNELLRSSKHETKEAASLF